MMEAMFKGSDGKEIFYRKWEVEQPEMVLQIVHGMNEHSGRYDTFAQFLNGFGIAVFATDHRGHGQTAGSPEQVGYIGEGAFPLMVEDEKIMNALIHETYAGVPVVMLGHSMGSFITQSYLQKHVETLAGCIIMGSSWKQSGSKLGSWLASKIEKRGDERTEWLEKIVFKSYNRRTDKLTKYDWLALDMKVVEQFLDDPYCAKTFPPSFYRQFLAFITETLDEKKFVNVPNDFPLFLVAGLDDPVGNYGRGMYKLYAQFEKKRGNADNLEMILYEGSRHEILNDTEKETVFNDIHEWLEKKIII